METGSGKSKIEEEEQHDEISICVECGSKTCCDDESFNSRNGLCVSCCSGAVEKCEKCEKGTHHIEKNIEIIAEEYSEIEEINNKEINNKEINNKEYSEKVQYFKPFYWWEEDRVTEDGKNFTITIWAHDVKNRTVALVIEDYNPWFQAILPEGMTDNECQLVGGLIFRTLEKKLRKDDHSPVDWDLSKRKRLYYYTKSTRHCIKLNFKSTDAQRHCTNILKKWPLRIRHNEEIPLEILQTESKMPQVVRCQTELNIDRCNWIAVSNVIKSTHPITTNQEFRISWHDIKQASKEKINELGPSHPSFIIFDGEMNSHKKRAFPNAINKKDIIFMTGILHAVWDINIKNYIIEEYCMIVTPLAKEDFKEIFGTKLVRISDKKYEVHREEKRTIKLMIFKEEMEHIKAFEDLIIELDPDGFIGHNSNTFDWNYYDMRKKRKLVKWENISRFSKFDVTMKNLRWESSAYAQNNLWFPICPGRISWDTLPMSKRDYRLDMYNLDFLGQYFLGVGKTGYTPEQLFDACQNPDVKTMTEAAIYCMRDVWVTWGLYQNRSFCLNYTQLSNIMGISIFDLYSRGMGLRTRTQVFKRAHHKGFFLNSRNDAPEEKMAGGYVFDQVPGLYELVMIFDFSGLYPSIQRWKNLCHTTLIRPNDNSVPEEEYNVIEWVDKHGEHKHRFLKYDPNRPETRGLLPGIQDELATERSAEKKEMYKYEEGTTDHTIHDKNQIGYKLCMNSIYGGCSQSVGDIYCVEVGSSITAIGRQLIKNAAKHVKEKWGAKLVYGDTDSIMIKVPGAKPEEIQELGKRIEKDMNDNVFEYPIKMEFERAFKIMFTHKKKLYGALVFDPERPNEYIKENFYSKGLITSRRDRCKFIRNLFQELLIMVLTKVPVANIFARAIEALENLLNGRVPIEDLITIKKLGKAYKLANYPMAIYSRHLHERGVNVQPGERLPYLLVKHENKLQGYHMEDPEIYEEFKDSEDPKKRLELDLILYLNSQVAKQIDQIFKTAFPKLFPAKFIEKLSRKLKKKECTWLFNIGEEQEDAPVTDCLVELMAEFSETLNK